jgi:hypothetical protein
MLTLFPRSGSLNKFQCCQSTGKHYATLHHVQLGHSQSDALPREKSRDVRPPTYKMAEAGHAKHISPVSILRNARTVNCSVTLDKKL